MVCWIHWPNMASTDMVCSRLCNFLFLFVFTGLSSFVLLFVLWFLNVVLLLPLKEGTPQQTCQWPRRTLQNTIGSGCKREKPNENSLLAAQCAMRNLYYREELKSEESYEENNCVMKRLKIDQCWWSKGSHSIEDESND